MTEQEFWQEIVKLKNWQGKSWYINIHGSIRWHKTKKTKEYCPLGALAKKLKIKLSSLPTPDEAKQAFKMDYGFLRDFIYTVDTAYPIYSFRDHLLKALGCKENTG